MEMGRCVHSPLSYPDIPDHSSCLHLPFAVPILNSEHDVSNPWCYGDASSNVSYGVAMCDRNALTLMCCTQVPIQFKLGPLTVLSIGLGLLPRGGKGISYRKSRIPEKPIEIWGYEASPFVRMAREVCITSSSAKLNSAQDLLVTWNKVRDSLLLYAILSLSFRAACCGPWIACMQHRDQILMHGIRGDFGGGNCITGI